MVDIRERKGITPRAFAVRLPSGLRCRLSGVCQDADRDETTRWRNGEDRRGIEIRILKQRRAIAVCSRIRSTDLEVGAEVLVPAQAQLGAYVIAVKVDRARGPREHPRDVLG